MRNFGMALFGGYKRDEVDKYVENLIDGLEELKEEQEGSVQQLQEELEQLRQQIFRQEQQLQEKERQLSAGEEERQQLVLQRYAQSCAQSQLQKLAGG